MVLGAVGETCSPKQKHGNLCWQGMFHTEMTMIRYRVCVCSRIAHQENTTFHTALLMHPDSPPEPNHPSREPPAGDSARMTHRISGWLSQHLHASSVRSKGASVGKRGRWLPFVMLCPSSAMGMSLKAWPPVYSSHSRMPKE